MQTNAAARTFFALNAPPAYYAAPLRERGYHTVVRDEHNHLLPEQYWPFVRVLQGEVLTGASTVALMVRTPHGRELAVDVSGAPVHDQDEQIVGAACVVRDVTERRRLERRTQDALEALLAMAQTLVGPPQGSNDADTSGQRGAGSVGQGLLMRLLVQTGRRHTGMVPRFCPSFRQYWRMRPLGHSADCADYYTLRPR